MSKKPIRRSKGVSLSRKLTPYAILAGAGLMAVAIAVSTTSSAPETEAKSLTVTGEGLPALKVNLALGEDPAFGMLAPLAEGFDWTGEPVVINPDDGRGKVVVFLAHWCPHCQTEVPWVQEWLNETGGHPDADLYAVATSNNRSRPNWPSGEWLAREGWSSPTIIDEKGRVATAYGLTAFPFWVVIDGQGRIVYRYAGGASVEGLVDFLQIAKFGASGLSPSVDGGSRTPLDALTGLARY